jgi:uncharacterized protein (DUF885 family)
MNSLPVDRRSDREETLQRWVRFGRWLDGYPKQLVERHREGIVSPRPVTRRVLAQLDSVVALTPRTSPLWSAHARSDDRRFQRAWWRITTRLVLPAMQRFHAFLDGPYLDVSRDGHDVGLGALPDGVDCYRALVAFYTTTDLRPDSLARLGRRDLARTRRRLQALSDRHFDGTPVDTLLARWRAGDLRGTGAAPFATSADVVAHAEATVARAEDALARYFDVRPARPVRVVPLPPAEDDGQPAGFYGTDDATGLYKINVSRPADRRLLAAVIAIHETVPGHHLQKDLHRAWGDTHGGGDYGSFMEGWATYAEDVADEMGLYATPLDRAGWMVRRLWTAARLVVDTGLHARGWSRAEAIAFLTRHTALTRAEVETEVDRHLAMPGQALAYHVGYVEIRRLRRTAEARLGAAFDVRAFHTAVLRGGGASLADLRRHVAAWIQAQAEHSARSGE